jgi:RNA polymerase sigma-70 factor, ECF subfamily
VTSGQRRQLSEMEDVRLVAQVAAGDTAAFAVLMERHHDLVFGIALRLMGNREAALDATQEAFITLFRKANRFRAEAAFTTWLYRVATNTCYDLLRKQKRRQADPLPEFHDPVDVHSEDRFGSVELRPAVETALASIPVDFRAAVILSDLEGLSLDEIAGVLDVPLGTVKSRIFRGRRLLADRLGNLLDTNRPLTDDA